MEDDQKSPTSHEKDQKSNSSDVDSEEEVELEGPIIN